jgi:hypothetical protein
MLRAIVAGLLICTVNACTSWNPVLVEPATYIGMHHPEEVRVQLRDGSTFLLGRPRVIGDTLRGIDAGSYRNVPLANVAALQAPEPARGRTALLAASSVAAGIALIVWVAASDRVN